MATYYRWIARGPDLKSAQQKILAVSASPRHACWIFNMTKYTPSSGVHADRILVAISFDATGEAIINDQSKWIKFPGAAFKGEAQHPDGIIVKTNEPGAYGLGQSVLKEINKGIKEMRLATRQELAAALGKQIPQSQVDVRMRLQRW